MSVTDRDRKILIVLVPLLAVLAYWFLLFSPKREEAAKAGEELAKQEQRRDSAVEQARALGSMKKDFAAEYADLVKLGKAIPSSVDMPSLLVQLDQAARGTGLKFKRVATGQRQTAPPPAQKGASGSSPPAAAGGTPAKSGPGKGAESAGNASADTQTSTTAKQGGLPVGGGAAAPGAAGAGASSGVPGLDSVPLDFEFEGSFFELADLFHRLKRFVQVANQKVLVRGRLLTIDSVSFSSGEARFPKLKAEITATVYLAPKAEGATAGATPQGPAGATPAGGTAPASPQGSQPAGATAPSSTSAPPTP